MTLRIHDPYLPRIWGLAIAGLAFTGMSLPGYLHQTEKIDLGIASIQMPAPLRKIPFSLAGAALMVLAWNETQNRRYWLEDLEEERTYNLQLRRVEQQMGLQAQAQAAQYLAQMQAAQRVYGQLQPYLEDEPRTVDAAVTPVQPTQQLPPAQPPHQPVTPAYQQPTQTWTPAPQQTQVGSDRPAYTPVTTAPVHDPYAYLDLFLEYPALVFGGQGSGKSWTARQLVAKKVAAGQRVIVLDPHAARHEWLGVEHIGSGMDYEAIAQFLREYLAQVKCRYQDFSSSGLSEEQWQARMRQQGLVMSVVCEELTNWADRVGEVAGQFVKCALTDSRKALMPPLLVSHNRTLSCLGNIQGLAHLRDASLLELELVPMVDEYTFKPVASGDGRLKLPGHGQWRDIRLPPATQKITDFRGYAGARQPQAPQRETQETTAPPQPRDPNRPVPRGDRSTFLDQARDWIKDCWDAGEAEETTTPSTPETPRDIPAHLKALVGYCEGKGWVKAIDVKRGCRAYKDLSTDAIRALFYQAVGVGIGRVKGDAEQLVYSVDSLQV